MRDGELIKVYFLKLIQERQTIMLIGVLLAQCFIEWNVVKRGGVGIKNVFQLLFWFG